MKRPLLIAVVATLATLVCPIPPAEGQSYVASNAGANLSVWRVEEAWEATIDNPDADLAAPHITTTFSPTGHGDGQHAIVNINHVTLDYFQPGGIQIQVWDGESPVTHQRVPWDDVLETSNEVVTWTQSMTHLGTSIIYQINNGHSTTWGNFGGQGFLTANVEATTSNLNAYDPTYSLANSGAPYASNRVTSLTLKTVKLFTTDGNTHTIQVNQNVITQ